MTRLQQGWSLSIATCLLLTIGAAAQDGSPIRLTQPDGVITKGFDIPLSFSVADRLMPGLRKDLLPWSGKSAFAPDGSGRTALAVVFDATHDWLKKDRFASKIFIFPASGKPTRQFDVEKGRQVEALRWSPKADRIAYLTLANDAQNSDVARQLTVIDLQTGKRTMVSKDAAALQWSADGKSLSFFQRSGKRWHAYRSMLSGNKLSAAKELFAGDYPAPGAFSHSGLQVAVVAGDEPLRIAKLEIRTADGNPVSTFEYEGMTNVQWSPDDRLLLVRHKELSGHLYLTRADLLDPASHTILSLDELVQNLAGDDKTSGPYNVPTIVFAAWLPANGHRLLFSTQMALGSDGGPMHPPPPAPTWRAYNADTKRFQRIDGVLRRGSAFVGQSLAPSDAQSLAPPDVRSLVLDGQLYHVDGAFE